MPPLRSEQLFRAFLRGPLSTKISSAANQFSGRTVLVSGSNTVVVSTRSIGSDSLVMINLQAATDQASGLGNHVEVKSINPGNALIMGWADPGGKPARDTTIMWMIVKGS